MILDATGRKEAGKSLTSKDFYREAHRYIFDALIQGNGDLTIMSNELQSRGLPEKCGGKEYLMELATVHSTPSALPHYVEIVKKLSHRRQIIEQCQITAEKAFHESDSIEEVLTEHRKSLSEIGVPAGQHGYRPEVDLSNVYTPERCLEE